MPKDTHYYKMKILYTVTDPVIASSCGPLRKIHFRLTQGIMFHIIKEKELHEIQPSVNRISQQLHEIQPSINRISQQLHEIQPSINRISQQLHEIQPSINRMSQQLHEIQPSINRISQQLHEIQPSINRISQQLRHNAQQNTSTIIKTLF